MDENSCFVLIMLLMQVLKVSGKADNTSGSPVASVMEVDSSYICVCSC